MRHAFLAVLLATCGSGLTAGEISTVTLRSDAQLVPIQIMIKSGSAAHTDGLEGLAAMTAQLLIEGGFGDADQPITKDRLAEMTRPLGSGAYPSVTVSKEATTFSVTVPRDRLESYVAEILQPMITQPHFAAAEMDRVRGEALQGLRSIRLEQIELVGLWTLDYVIHENTPYAHPNMGTERGLEQIDREAVLRFYRQHYTQQNLILGVGTDDPQIVDRLQQMLQKLPAGSGPLDQAESPPPVRGRDVTIVALPNAIASGLHAGFPLPINRSHPDYWPLYVANIYFGTHRDSFGHLYQQIRQNRGYNYGNYSYIEHFAGRPANLFPPTNTPRDHQYFSLWIRPVQHEYAHHLLKAMTFELDDLIQRGLTDEQCELAKNKASVLYLSLAETTRRLLSYRVDDAYYGMADGYLNQYLDRIDAVTTAQVNAAIRKYLQSGNLRYVVVTDDDQAAALADAIAADGVVYGKPPEDYQIPSVTENGQQLLKVAPDKLEILRRDAAWAHYRLNVPRERIRILPAEQLFK